MCNLKNNYCITNIFSTEYCVNMMTCFKIVHKKNKKINKSIINNKINMKSLKNISSQFCTHTTHAHTIIRTVYNNIIYNQKK